MQELLDALSELFDAEVVEWRVTNTSAKHGQVDAGQRPAAPEDIGTPQLRFSR